MSGETSEDEATSLAWWYPPTTSPIGTVAADTLSVASEVDREAWVRWNVNTWFGGNRAAPVRQEVTIRFRSF